MESDKMRFARWSDVIVFGMMGLCGVMCCLAGCGPATRSGNDKKGTRPSEAEGMEAKLKQMNDMAETGQKNRQNPLEKKSAEDYVNASLEKNGLRTKEALRQNRYVDVGVQSTKLESRVQFNEAFRQVAYRKAFIEAMCRLALTRKVLFLNESWIDSNDELISSLSGAQVVTYSEFYNTESDVYEVAVAVGWSPRTEGRAKAIVAGALVKAEQAPGKKSLADWIEANINSTSLGPRTFVDDHGDRWMLGTVAVDEAMRNYVDRWFDGDEKASEEFKLRAYALDGVGKLLNCEIRERFFFQSREKKGSNPELYKTENLNVTGQADEAGLYNREGDAAEMLYSTLKSGDRHVQSFVLGSGIGQIKNMKGKEKLTLENEASRSEHSLKTGFYIHPDNPRLKWSVRKMVDPFSEKEFELWVGAIRCNDIVAGEKERLVVGK